MKPSLFVLHFTSFFGIGAACVSTSRSDDSLSKGCADGFFVHEDSIRNWSACLPRLSNFAAEDVHTVPAPLWESLLIGFDTAFKDEFHTWVDSSLTRPLTRSELAEYNYTSGKVGFEFLEVSRSMFDENHRPLAKINWNAEEAKRWAEYDLEQDMRHPSMDWDHCTVCQQLLRYHVEIVHSENGGPFLRKIMLSRTRRGSMAIRFEGSLSCLYARDTSELVFNAHLVVLDSALTIEELRRDATMQNFIRTSESVKW